MTHSQWVISFLKKYAPCFCKVRPGELEILFTIEALEEMVLSVEIFELDRLEEYVQEYVPVGVGGQWWIYHNGLITIRLKKELHLF